MNIKKISLVAIGAAILSTAVVLTSQQPLVSSAFFGPFTSNYVPKVVGYSSGLPVYGNSKLTDDGTTLKYNGTAIGSGSGTVTNFAFTNGGGFTGTVTNPTTAPTLALTYAIPASVAQYRASIITTTALTDTVTVTGVAATSVCIFSAANAAAAADIETNSPYITAGANSVTITYVTAPAAAGDKFNVLCTGA